MKYKRLFNDFFSYNAGFGELEIFLFVLIRHRDQLLVLSDYLLLLFVTYYHRVKNFLDNFCFVY